MRTIYQERTVLGSRLQLALVTDASEGQAEEVFRALWLEIFLFEKRCSRFLPGSELSRFNRSAGARLDITPEFRDALLAAQRMADWTGGLFNPFILPALQRAGYDHSLLPAHEHDASDDHSTRRLVAASELEIGDHWARIPYGSAIDLGGCGKGYIGDHLAALAANHPDGGRLAGFWFAIGGDVITQGVDEAGQPWTVYLQPDPKADRRIGEVTVPGEGSYAVATSTTAYRRGQKGGQAWHHIIDPRSGRPADTDVSLATVCGRSLLEADVLASCAIIVGSAEVAAFLRDHEVRDGLWQGGQDRKKGGIGKLGSAIRLYE